jgi:transposase
MKANLKDFSGESIYVGIDSHLKSWNITIMSDEMELRNFTQEPDSKKLSSFLRRHYPGADYQCVYEAGFAGFNAQRELIDEGIPCMVIHPADVPTSDKEKRQKSDRVDSRKLARGLKNKDFEAIYVPTLQQQQDRSLLRINDKITRDITRVKNRIKSFLRFFGIVIPKEFQGKNWSKGFINWLENVNPGGNADTSIAFLLNGYSMLRGQEIQLDKQIKDLSEQVIYKEKVTLLMTIPGIGLQTAMILLTEIWDINRFPHFKSLCCYFGLVPDCHDSGETKRVGGNTKRGNVYLKYILIEISWMCIRYDSSLLLTYKSAVRVMDSNKAIIKVARKLLNRIRFVLKNNKSYQVLAAEERGK